MSQWVQHKSGQGEKWELDHCVHALDVWNVKSNTWIRLPKSEYIPCDPPEEWEDVTGECEIGRYGSDELITATGLNGYMYMTDRSREEVNVLAIMSYRLRKIDGPHNGPCFIVERRKS